MKLHQVRDFIAVVRAGSIRQAARDLNMSQPALTKSIRALEKDLGTPLFERTATGAFPNEFGRLFMRHAELASNELNRGREQLNHLLTGRGGEVAIAVSGTPSMLFVPRALQAFHARYPDARVRIVEGLVPLALPGLRDGSLDFALLPEPIQPLGQEFSVTPVYRGKRTVVGRKGHPLSKARSLSGLLGARWLVTGASGSLYVEFEEPFRALGLAPPAAKVQCESLIALVCLLANSDLLAILPVQWAQAPLTAKVLEAIPIQESLDAPAICMIKRAALPSTPLAEVLADALLREAQHLQNEKRP